MQVTQTNEEGLKREFRVVIAASEIGAKLDARLDELKRNVRMPGFRPGKVPVTLLKKRFGGALRGEILEDALRAGTQQAIDDHALRPAAEPKIEVTKFEEDSDLEYTMSVEVLPEIEPVDPKDIGLERLVSVVNDDDVAKALERLATQHKSFEPAPEGHVAATGDALVIDFVGSVDGERFEGGSATDHQLELGSSAFVGTFEDQLIGAKAGDHVEVNITFPETYANDELAGKPALFEVDVKEIKIPLAVEVDDAFATNLGLDDLEALRKSVREQLDRERGILSRARLKRSLLDALADKHKFEVPPTLAEMEYESIWRHFQEDLKRTGQTYDDLGRSEADVEAEYRGIAERRVRLGLLLTEVGRNNNIEVQEDELGRAMVEEARRFPGEEQKVLEFFQKDASAAERLKAPILEEKVVDFLIEMAQVSEREVSFEELMRDPDEDSEEAAEATDSAEPKKKAKKKATKKVGAKKKKAKASSQSGKGGEE